jgi:hypothetical protein
MGRSSLERYTESIDYIRTKIDIPLATKLTAETAGKKKTLGRAISLRWGGFKNVGTKDHHKALRALLLCQQHFLKPPQCPTDRAGNGKVTKANFKLKSEAQIQDAIRAYTRSPDVTPEQFAQTALAKIEPGGGFDPLARTRNDTGMGGVANCYGAVKYWLFMSGCCSLAWYFKDGSRINAYTVNEIIGNGVLYAEDKIDTIPRGYIFNLQDSKALDVCHWGVSLGNGWAAASNTTPGAMGPKGALFVNFRKGNAAYGEFLLKEALEVCKLKYDSGVVTIKALDPTRSQNYY